MSLLLTDLLHSFPDDTIREILSYLDDNDKQLYASLTNGSQNFVRDIYFFLLIKSLILDFFREFKEQELQILFYDAAVFVYTEITLCEDIDSAIDFWNAYVHKCAKFRASLEKTISRLFQRFAWYQSGKKTFFLTQVKSLFDEQSKLCLQGYKNVEEREYVLPLFIPDHYVWDNNVPLDILSPFTPVGIKNLRLIHKYKKNYRQKRWEMDYIECDSDGEPMYSDPDDTFSLYPSPPLSLR
jgi:hypothetical protein